MIGFVIGVLVGMLTAMFVLSLCAAAREGDRNLR